MMFDDNLLAGNAGLPGVSTYTDQVGSAGTPVIARLNEPDRRAVDTLLSGEPVDGGDSTSASHLDRVNSARTLLSLLDNLPAEEPPANLVQATLQFAFASGAGGEVKKNV